MIHTVKSYPAVVADDPASRISVGKSRNYSHVSRRPHLVGINAEHAVVVRGTIFELGLYKIGHFIAVSVARLFAHSLACERIDGALERRIRLQADDDILFFVDISGSVRKY